MSFERQRRVASVWSWLPTFRAAAEFESLQRASLALGLSVSAVSRAIKQLEDDLGFPVLERHVTGVSLTVQGAQLLDATRTGMRLVDDAISFDSTKPASIGVTGPFLPALATAWLPEGTYSRLRVIDAPDVEALLLRGVVDVALTELPVPHHQLETREVGTYALAQASKFSHAPLLENPPCTDLHALLTLAGLRSVAIVVPAQLVPEGWHQTPHSSLPLHVTFRSGNERRHESVLTALARAVK